MSEEEKEAIEYFSVANILYNLGLKDMKYLDDMASRMNILLNLVEKLQKEIEENQVLIDDIKEHNIVYIDTPEFEEKFISKDKIREKIKEYQEKFNNTNGFVFKQEYLQKVKVLNELLEEN